MNYKITADFIVLVHLGWILFLILGALLGRRFRWVMWLHLGGLVFSIILQIQSWHCPLTQLEAWLRKRHDPSLDYTGSFVAHYAENLIYLEVPPAAVFIGTIGVIMFSTVIYWRFQPST